MPSATRLAFVETPQLTQIMLQGLSTRRSSARISDVSGMQHAMLALS